MEGNATLLQGFLAGELSKELPVCRPLPGISESESPAVALHNLTTKEQDCIRKFFFVFLLSLIFNLNFQFQSPFVVIYFKVY